MIKLIVVSAFLIGGTVAGGVGLAVWHGTQAPATPSLAAPSALPEVKRSTRYELGRYEGQSAGAVRPAAGTLPRVPLPQQAALPSVDAMPAPAADAPVRLPQNRPVATPSPATGSVALRAAPVPARAPEAYPVTEGAPLSTVVPYAYAAPPREAAEMRKPVAAQADAEPGYFIGVYR
ncbi:hypothetical protein [Thioclava sp. GXIMD4215]|uniref:hypothetical protein n=1 Tax=Thioclava sp. GXIMD4215 TaxID=3131928 RepID=UPI00311AE0DA